jgi:cytochrome c553
MWLLVCACGTGDAPAASTPDPGTVPPERAEAPGPAAEVAAALALEGDLDRGAHAYESCAVCHGRDGRGRDDGTFPQLAGQHRSVLIKQLVDIREGRRRNPVMAPYAEALIDSQELADVASYVRSLPIPASAQGSVDGDVGGALYLRDCGSCHGAQGEGNAEGFVPMLAGQHEAYLLRQIRAIAAGRRENAHPDMKARVSDYADDELRAVVRYAAGLPAPRAATR